MRWSQPAARPTSATSHCLEAAASAASRYGCSPERCWDEQHLWGGAGMGWWVEVPLQGPGLHPESLLEMPKLENKPPCLIGARSLPMRRKASHPNICPKYEGLRTAAAPGSAGSQNHRMNHRTAGLGRDSRLTELQPHPAANLPTSHSSPGCPGPHPAWPPTPPGMDGASQPLWAAVQPLTALPAHNFPEPQPPAALPPLPAVPCSHLPCPRAASPPGCRLPAGAAGCTQLSPSSSSPC